MKAYPVNALYEEMAFIAHHFHWSRDQLMTLEHRERRRWCRRRWAERWSSSPLSWQRSDRPLNDFLRTYG